MAKKALYLIKEQVEALMLEPSTAKLSEVIGETFYNSYAADFETETPQPENIAYADTIIGVGTIWDSIIEVTVDKKSVTRRGIAALAANLKKHYGQEINVVAREASVASIRIGDAAADNWLLSKKSYGTIGGLWHNKAADRLKIISNNHVFANSNNGEVGDMIFHKQNDTFVEVATLSHFARIIPEEEKAMNDIDLAVARVETVPQLHYVSPNQYREVTVGERVWKIGARTGMRMGKVTSTDYTAKVRFPGFKAVFRDQIQIMGAVKNLSFSAPGDSGSTIFSVEDGRWVGLLFAGDKGNTITFANPASKVYGQMEDWGITI